MKTKKKSAKKGTELKKRIKALFPHVKQLRSAKSFPHKTITIIKPQFKSLQQKKKKTELVIDRSYLHSNLLMETNC